MADTSIQWTDATWNVVTGCTKVSPGCAHCYAETIATRFWPTQYVHTVERGFIACRDYHGERMDRARSFTDVVCHPERLEAPLRWKKPRRVFVNSMSDLFHEDVPDAFIDRVFAVMALCPQHTFQILTKRADRMRDYVNGLGGRLGELWDLTNQPTWVELPAGRSFPRYPENWPLPNVWAGVSVENQPFADERIHLLLQTPAAIRFVSYEPALGLVDFRQWLGGQGRAAGRETRSPLTQHGAATPGENFGSAAGNVAKPQLDPSGAVASSTLPSLDWVIVGGESGPKARPCDVAWIRSVVEQCKASGVPCFVKQLGKWPLSNLNENERGGRYWVALHDGRGNYTGEYGCEGRGAKSDPAEWPEDLRVREFPRRSAV